MAEWQPEADGEYNAQVTTIHDHQFRLYSDRDGAEWWVEIDDADTQRLDATDLEQAQAEVEALAEAY